MTTQQFTESLDRMAAAAAVRPTPAVYTHGGLFHGDDVAAVAAVRLLRPAAPVRRVFALPSPVPMGSVVLDIGGIYDPADGRFDHHMVEGHPTARPNGCPRAAFGAIWASEWGRDICGAVAGAAYPDLPWGAASRIRDALDAQIVQGIDAQDEHWAPRLAITVHGELAASVEGWWSERDVESYLHFPCPLPQARPGQPLSLSAVISGFNPRYDEPSSPADRDAAFEVAVAFMEGVLRRAILSEAATIMAEATVLEAQTYVPQDSQRTTLVLPRFVPWQEALPLRPDQAGLLYVIFPSERGGFCVQQVPVRPGAGEGRKPLPKAWAGLRGKALEAAADLDGQLGGDAPSVFCHPGRFVGGAETLEAALTLARAAVEA